MKKFVSYHERLNTNGRFAEAESDAYFEARSANQVAMKYLSARLDQYQIEYAVAGILAFFYHGYRRFTDELDVVVTRDGLQAIHEKLIGHGYIAAPSCDKKIYDLVTGVEIRFLVSGEFAAKPELTTLKFPEPSESVEMCGTKFVTLPGMIDMKLASSMVGLSHICDLAIVVEAVKVLHLSEDFVNQLNPAVEEKFREICRDIKNNPDNHSEL